jgi:hypothetical protein
MGSRKDSDAPEESEQELEQHAGIDFVTFGMLILGEASPLPALLAS